LYYDYGVDSIASCIQFLVEEKHWKKDRSGINASEFDVSLSEEKLIDHIEKNKLTSKLDKITEKVWNDIEEKIKLDREPKYGE